MAKADITFADTGKRVRVAVGSRVVEVSEQAGSGIVYGCCECECGICLMKVEAGLENLAEPSILEARVLREQLAGRRYRLACQAQILGDITISPA